MGNVIKFDNAQVPAHIAKRFSGMAMTNDDLAGGVGQGGFPVISYKGKVWHVSEQGNRTLVANEEGDPKASIEVVILKANPNLSKTYYPTGYEEGVAEKPVCYSNDSIAPARDAQDPQAPKCAVCPHNQWGSRITENGGKGKACNDVRRLAVAPAYDLEKPMLLRIPPATLKDLAKYAESLSKRQVPYQAVITKIGFDHTVAHQKFTFKPLRFLEEEEAETVAEVMEREIIDQITGLAMVQAAAPDTDDEDEIPGAMPKALAKPAAKPVAKAKPKPAHVVEEDEIDDVLETAPKAKAKPAPVVEDDDDDDMFEAPKPKAKAKPAPVVEDEDEEPAPVAKKSTAKVLLDEIDASLDDVLASLDD